MNFDIDRVISILQEDTQQWGIPVVTELHRITKSPYKVLISCLMSLRTKDEVTAEASTRLYSLANTPEEMLSLSYDRVVEAIYPVGFYKTKAQQILDISRQLVDNYAGLVPSTIDELLKFKGVGRKTANLVITVGYGLPGICVDTHVHRITNRWEYVKTTSPDKTEMMLRAKLPQKHWLVINDLLVTYGQNLCRPISPMCSKCRLTEYCKRVGVATSR